MLAGSVRASDWTVEGLPPLPDCQLLVVLCVHRVGLRFRLWRFAAEVVKGGDEVRGGGRKSEKPAATVHHHPLHLRSESG